MSLALAQPPPEIDVDVQKVVLAVTDRKLRNMSATITGSIVDGSIERTIDGASTLTLVVHDPKRVLLSSGIFGGQGNPIAPVDVRVDRLSFRLVQVSKSGDDLTLTFEDREVAWLRLYSSPRKAARASVTRAEFALSLVREVKQGTIPFVCPELHITQAVAIETNTQTKASTKQTGDKGINVATKGLLIWGSPASAEQKANAERVLDVASSLNASAKATLALVEAVIVESNIRNPSSESADGFGSTGILQVRHVTAGPLGIDPLDIEACCNTFLTRGFTGRGGAIALAKQNPGWTAGQIAQACQGSAYPTRYDEHEAEAQAFVDAYSGGGSYSRSPTTRNLPYQFQRGTTDGKRESSWTCLQRLAQEVNWRCFASAGSIYFVSDRTLINSRPRLVVSEETPGVTSIDFDVDSGKQSDQVTITARASRWLGAPGDAVAIQDLGPASGRWLISSLRRGIFDAQATITLTRAAKPLPEPAADQAATSPDPNATSGGSVANPSGVREIDLAYSAARSITRKRYPYVWGGGHGGAGIPSGGPPVGYDCSGSVCAMLAAGGLGFRPGGPVDVSGTIASNWGEPGKGKYLTVYANPVHVFAVFHGVGKPGDEHFGTGDWGKGWGGAGLNPEMHFLDGFTARHYPGT